MKLIRKVFGSALVLEGTEDHSLRGSMRRLYNESQMSDMIEGFVIRDLRSYLMPKSGTFFGIHYHADSHPINKLITVISGRGMDYIVDLRKGSPTYLRWEQTELSAENGYSVYVPHGFGHAFISTADDTIQIFAADGYGGKGVSKQLNYREKAVGLVLPIPVSAISDYDENAPFLVN